MSRVRLLAALTALVLVFSAASLALALTRPDRPEVLGPRLAEDGTYLPGDFAGPAGAALDIATVAVPLAGTYDYRNLDGSLSAATAGMTPALASSFSATFDANRRAFTKAEEVTDSRVLGAGVVAVPSPTEVRCLLYVDQRVVRSTPTEQRPGMRVTSHRRLLVDMVLRDGTWKISAVTGL